MKESQLITNLKQLKQIKPREEWAVLTKQNLFRGEEVSRKNWMGDKVSMVLDVFPRFLFDYHHYKYVLATFVFGLLIASSTLIYAKNALPGDVFYTLKRAKEKAITLLTPDSQMPKMQLEFTNERLKELTVIAESKQNKKLSSAIKEFQASAKVAALNIKNIKSMSRLENKDIVQEAKKIESAREKIQALGVEIGDTEELNSALSELVDREIKDLEGKTLTEGQKELLNQIKVNFEEKEYSQALENILLLTQDEQ